MKIYAVKDVKAETFNNPFFQKNDITALRALSLEVNRADPGNVVYTHPQDFDLYELGDYDPDTGEITSISPVLVANGRTLVNKEPK